MQRASKVHIFTFNSTWHGHSIYSQEKILPPRPIVTGSSHSLKLWKFGAFSAIVAFKSTASFYILTSIC